VNWEWRKGGIKAQLTIAATQKEVQDHKGKQINKIKETSGATGRAGQGLVTITHILPCSCGSRLGSTGLCNYCRAVAFALYDTMLYYSAV